MSKNTNLSFLTDYITADITNGRIGINNASPAYAFDVTGIARTSTSTYLATASGNVGIGTTTPATQLSILSLTPSSSTLDAIFNITNDVDSNFRIFVTGSAASDKRTAIGATTNTALAFITNTTERMRITSGGSVLIGMSSAVGFRSDAQLQVGNCAILKSSDGYNGNPSAVIYSNNDQSGTILVEFTSSGFSRIGSITRNGASNVSYNTGSDIRIKKNIIDAPTSLEKLNSIQVRSFDWVEDDAHQDFGFIAQELINVMPVAVTRGAKEKDIWQVDNSKLVPLLVKSIQELKAEIEILKQK